jgi:uncharacterized membrane protein YesL
LAYPGNLTLSGIAGFLLALPVVTWLAAAIAVGRALHRWRGEGDDRVFTNTFREFAASWRTGVPLSVAATALVALVAIDWAYLSSRDGPVVALLAAALVPVCLLLLAVVVHLPAASALDPGGGARAWVVGAVRIVVLAPLDAVLAVVASVTWLALCLVVPTLVPFLGLSVPAFAGLVAARRVPPRAGA